MGVVGYYTIELVCESNCETMYKIKAQDRQTALMSARALGWRITTDKVLCPSCKERKAS